MLIERGRWIKMAWCFCLSNLVTHGAVSRWEVGGTRLWIHQSLSCVLSFLFDADRAVWRLGWWVSSLYQTLWGAQDWVLEFRFIFLWMSRSVSPCPLRLVWPVGNVWFVFISPSFLEQGLRPRHISCALHPRLWASWDAHLAYQWKFQISCRSYESRAPDRIRV